MKKERLQKYARLAVEVGVNVQEGQLLIINSPVECQEFTRLLVKAAYAKKAANVIVRWGDDLINKMYYENVSEAVLQEVPHYLVEQFKYFVDQKAAVITISAPTPGLLKDIDAKRLQLSAMATQKAIDFYRKHMMSNGSQWCVIAYPTEAWAQKVFPGPKAFERLLDSILVASRVRDDNDPVAEWHEHMETLARHNAMLNQYNFLSLHFQNSLGTDLSVGLVENHLWGGGGEYTKDGIYFAPNIPTEETFTMPHKLKVNGKVVATKPLNYQGKLIEDFWLVFKDGKVVDYDAKKEKEALKNLLEFDEGSSYLGEVALISFNSPISNMNVLFYNTLFDENASCHLALGNAYTMSIQGGNEMEESELLAKGYNKSMTHVDFMFGSSDMKIIGITHEQKRITVFENGNFSF
ncbi:MAG TPA: aminopeptidase [Bacilli bacterium]|nr:MAG: Aminopeptidase 2 [Tenericutes bacterium ADurb.BinA124]HNZ50006.1 aminopeptidase [Bacilli bacterium]HPX84366.1 aminopeptidase [Bacilli bacterium]HQC73975.1 aminopeptidase [Bacilli bacterium]